MSFAQALTESLEEADVTKPEWKRALAKDEADLEKLDRDIETMEGGGKVQNMSLSAAKKNRASLAAAVENKKKLLGKMNEDSTYEKQATAVHAALSAKGDFDAWTPKMVVAAIALARGPKIQPDEAEKILDTFAALGALQKVAGGKYSVKDLHKI